MPLALITGGSAGLGAAFADRLASRGHDLLLVARGADALSVTAREISARHGVRVDVLAADLAGRHGLFRLEALLSGPEGLTVDVLVNNAAYESAAPFPHADRSDVQTEIDLNVTATMRLTHAVLPGMLRRGRGAVINVGSVTGWLPSAGSSYGPTKAWVAAFTDSLVPVVAGTGVRALAFCPGFVRTGWNGREEPTGPSLLWTDAGPAVDACLADLDRGRALSVPGPVMRPLIEMLEAPRRTLRALARVAGTSREARWAREDLAAAPVTPTTATPVRRRPVQPGAPAASQAVASQAVASEAVASQAVSDGPPARPDRPSLPDLPARPAQRSSYLPHPARSPHFVRTSRLTGEARARADRAQAQPRV